MNTALTETQRHRLCENAIAAYRDAEGRTLNVCHMLYDIRKDKHYLAGWDSWEEYCMEFRKDPTTLTRMARVWEVFSIRYGFTASYLAEAGGWSNLAELLPLLKAENTPRTRAEELIGIVAHNTRKNARVGLSLAKKGIPECKHKTTRLLLLEICEDGCGDRWNVTDDYRITKR